MHELILGGARSGKSRAAEARAAAWLARPGHQALFIATAWAADAEMAARIARHQADRAQRVPGLPTRELAERAVGADGADGPDPLAALLRAESAPQRLLLVDCLTLWLAQLALPPQRPPAPPAVVEAGCRALVAAVQAAPGPLVLVSNEIGLGVLPLGAETRAYVDRLGHLHQALAAACSRVTLMVAGLPLPLKGAAG